ncbi:hypothetical protein BJ742DRAFT_871997 [Cladochytrium replicatum]|nr:hypothetical protein BJ742DRAFT_871997 [Cladochytrium replicatum]
MNYNFTLPQLVLNFTLTPADKHKHCEFLQIMCPVVMQSSKEQKSLNYPIPTHAPLSIPMSYKRFLVELKKVASSLPANKYPPKLYNYHKFIPGPFPSYLPAGLTSRPGSQTEWFSSKNLGDTMEAYEGYSIRLKSERHDAAIAAENLLRSAGSPKQSKHVAMITDLPLPHVLRRHIQDPSSSLATNKESRPVLGFRIQMNGKRGLRSAKTVMQWGSMATSSVGSSYVDYAKASFVDKRGASGIKVWVAYAK